MIHPSTQRLETALGVSKEYLDLERKRLGRVGFRGPGRLSVVARVVLAWEGLRGGGQPPADVAHAVGYSGLPALDRALVKVAGVAAQESCSNTACAIFSGECLDTDLSANCGHAMPFQCFTARCDD
jgi:hypothetical protein